MGDDTYSEAPVLRVLGLAGSLSRASLSRGLLRVAQRSAPNGVTVDLHDLGTVPLFNRDLELFGDPEPVHELKRAIRAADALLISTPEHNGGLPGVLVNAVDWASRPVRRSVLAGKPVAVMAVAGGSGGAGALQALRGTLACVGAMVLAEDVAVARARPRLDAAGEVVDEEVERRVAELLEALAVTVPRPRAAEPAA
jgi:chromate reductase